MEYYFSKKTDFAFEEAILKITEELMKEGFGVLTRIDMDKKFKEKLNIDFKKYSILGACNPTFAYKALQIEDKIGIMLPCNVIIQEIDDFKTEVAIVNPEVAMQPVNNLTLEPLAQEVKIKLERALGNI
jgi:uncharacterized protein (DUF302 family)